MANFEIVQEKPLVETVYMISTTPTTGIVTGKKRDKEVEISAELSKFLKSVVKHGYNSFNFAEGRMADFRVVHNIPTTTYNVVMHVELYDTEHVLVRIFSGSKSYDYERAYNDKCGNIYEAVVQEPERIHVQLRNVSTAFPIKLTQYELASGIITKFHVKINEHNAQGATSIIMRVWTDILSALYSEVYMKRTEGMELFSKNTALLHDIRNGHLQEDNRIKNHMYCNGARWK